MTLININQQTYEKLKELKGKVSFDRYINLLMENKKSFVVAPKIKKRFPTFTLPEQIHKFLLESGKMNFTEEEIKQVIKKQMNQDESLFKVLLEKREDEMQFIKLVGFDKWQLIKD